MGGPGYDLNQWQHGDMAVLLHLCVNWWVVLSVAIATFRVCIVTWLARGGVSFHIMLQHFFPLRVLTLPTNAVTGRGPPPQRCFLSTLVLVLSLPLPHPPQSACTTSPMILVC